MCFALHWPNRFRCFPPSFFFARNGAERRAAHLMFFVAFFRCFRFVHSINSDNNFISHFSELSSSYSLFSSHIVFFSVAPYFFFLNNNANYSSFFHFGAESTLQKKKQNILIYSFIVLRRIAIIIMYIVCNRNYILAGGSNFCFHSCVWLLLWLLRVQRSTVKCPLPKKHSIVCLCSVCLTYSLCAIFVFFRHCVMLNYHKSQKYCNETERLKLNERTNEQIIMKSEKKHTKQKEISRQKQYTRLSAHYYTLRTHNFAYDYNFLILFGYYTLHSTLWSTRSATHTESEWESASQPFQLKKWVFVYEKVGNVYINTLLSEYFALWSKSTQEKSIFFSAISHTFFALCSYFHFPILSSHARALARDFGIFVRITHKLYLVGLCARERDAFLQALSANQTNNRRGKKILVWI